jgi:DNA polymerase III epsilon subunit-like protein
MSRCARTCAAAIPATSGADPPFPATPPLAHPLQPWTDVPLHVLDFEGGPRTGVVEFGAVTLLGGRLVGLATAACAPRTDIPPEETRCHGLATADLRGRRPFEARWDDFQSLRASGLLAAHQASVEARLLAATWPHPAAVPAVSETAEARAEWGPWIDTLALARRRRPGLGDYSLEHLVARLGLEAGLAETAVRLCPEGRRRYHAAGFDALAAALVLLALAGPAEPLGRLLADSAPAGSDAARGQGELPL